MNRRITPPPVLPLPGGGKQFCRRSRRFPTFEEVSFQGEERRSGRADREAGTALVTVLVMLAVLAMLASLAVEAAGLSLRRGANLAANAQARWTAMGAESFAIARIKELANAEGAARPDASVWQDRPFTFPLNGGTLTLTLRDGANCLNLNALASAGEDGETSPAAAEARLHLARLMDLVGVRGGETQSLVASLVDFIDADQLPSPGGAEAEAYQGDGYRPPDGLIGDVSELARVKGFSPAAVAALRAYVCVRPNVGPMRLNPNTMSLDQAPLLSALIGPALSLDRAAGVIRNRPVGGWESVERFLASPEMAALGLTEAAAQNFDLSLRYIVLETNVAEGGVELGAATLIDARGEGRVVRRVFGVGRMERAL